MKMNWKVGAEKYLDILTHEIFRSYAVAISIII